MFLYQKCCFSEKKTFTNTCGQHAKVQGRHANDLSPSYNAWILPENGKNPGGQNRKKIPGRYSKQDASYSKVRFP